ncbi:hypothetical protein DFH08DRAFT_628552, partial [Mycena albidolilacea]
GGTSVYKERLCNVLVRFVPVTFDPAARGALEAVSNNSGFPRGALAKARWIKLPERRRAGQRVAHAVFGFSNPSAANSAMCEGMWVDGSRVYGHKMLTEPIRCLRCQEVGHIAAACTMDREACARCGEEHCTSTCNVSDDERACANCKSAQRDFKGHGVADRACPFFSNKLQRLRERNPEAVHPYFLVPEDPSSWVTHEETDTAYTP